ncbi:hypothetical protein Hdeb2414_s0002g00073631 [Helianthus debilis subsp. tardiflorus]
MQSLAPIVFIKNKTSEPNNINKPHHMIQLHVTNLSREVTDDVSGVASPQRHNSLILDCPTETITNTLVWLRKTTSLDHLILVLDQKLDTLNRSSSGFRNSS